MCVRNTNMNQAYDSHCNLVLGEVEETIYVIDDDEEEDEDEVVKVRLLQPNEKSERPNLRKRQ